MLDALVTSCDLTCYLDAGRYVQQRVSHPQENTFNWILKMCLYFQLNLRQLTFWEKFSHLSCWGGGVWKRMRALSWRNSNCQLEFQRQQRGRRAFRVVCDRPFVRRRYIQKNVGFGWGWSVWSCLMILSIQTTQFSVSLWASIIHCPTVPELYGGGSTQWVVKLRGWWGVGR